MTRDDTYYEAMCARDHRFDGKFFVGVKTTGIYCRPICPAKPKRQNVEFFATRFEAERAGYRPCLRCRPEASPQSPAWVGTSAVVQRAVKVLHSRSTIDFNEDEFAELFGVTARHLRRLFQREIGKTPKQLSFEHRLNLARQLIVETSLPIAEVAFAAGFASVRRFNGSFKERFRKNPREIRRQKLPVGSGLSVSLAYRPPFDFAGLLQSYRNHRVGDLEWFSEGKMHRVVSMGGRVGQIAISDDPARSSIVLEIDFPDTAMIHAIIAKVRTLFDLDSDPVLVGNVLEKSPTIRKLWRLNPGIRLPSGWDGFEVAIATILGQLVSVARGRALVADMIERYGLDSGLERDGKMVKLFPTPAMLAEANLSEIKTTAVRRASIIEFSRAVAAGEISLEPTQDVGAFVKKVLAIRGIGPWTAHYMALKVLRSADSFPASDLVLARAVAEHTPRVIEDLSPWRGYAAALFWRSHS